MFQGNAFQKNAFQIGGFRRPAGDSKYTYASPYQRYVSEESQREKIRKQKSDLDRLNSVLEENKRKAALAAESKKIAQDNKNKARLQRLEQQYLDEITRLLTVRVELIKRVRQSEELLICMMAMKRRRLRTINWQAMKPLAIH